ncbi:MAG: methionine--tRNA ligase [Methylacidiphilales bacterium]|nr:methionine--tRNA ligase [Candidatus Methylacidiphilales bacterium]
MSKTILITSALPYANGPIHIGHLLEHIQTDTYARAARMFGNTCWYVCADDAHGTPIMISAKNQQCTPLELITKLHQEHKDDFALFSIMHDCYHSTHSSENQTHTNRVYQLLKSKGLITRKLLPQMYDEASAMFLPDRFIRGECPKCKSPEQYGDGCEVCGATYSPADLINPRSFVSGTKPIIKESEHLFFELTPLREFLHTYITSCALQSEIANKMKEWVEGDLKAWDISREAPYFGFLIPDEVDKYFYVWLDAPIGYIASSEKLLTTLGRDINDVWGENSDVDLIHVIGKDIAYFHCLFWPAMLHAAGHRTPTQIQCHGFITIQGEKMSKSKGNFITARDWAQQQDTDHLRYYLCAKMQGTIVDMDLDFNEFELKINADLIGKFVNIPSRCAQLLATYCDHKTTSENDINPFATHIEELFSHASQLYLEWKIGEVIKDSMRLADMINSYLSDAKPWSAFKNPTTAQAAQQTCTFALEAFVALASVLSPIIPTISKNSLALFLIKQPCIQFTSLRGITLQPFTQLSARVNRSKLDSLVP